jgi:hypothetical protein
MSVATTLAPTVQLPYSRGPRYDETRFVAQLGA